MKKKTYKIIICISLFVMLFTNFTSVFGAIESGGYEGSNVDIAAELSNMITAQRMIQMNSRVFSTASSVMETLAYLGQ